MTPFCTCGKWRSWQRGVPWPVFADRVLAVLEATQDKTCDKDMTINWFLSKRLAHFDMQTPQEVALQGQGRLVVLAVSHCSCGSGSLTQSYAQGS